MSLNALLAAGGGLMFSFEGTVSGKSLTGVTVTTDRGKTLDAPYASFVNIEQGYLKRLFALKIGDQVRGQEVVSLGKLPEYTFLKVRMPD